MPKIDIDNYIEQSGMRKARFGGYEPEDVRQAMLDLCADYEQHLAAATAEARAARAVARDGAPEEPEAMAASVEVETTEVVG